jgi:hypothetical protein
MLLERLKKLIDTSCKPLTCEWIRGEHALVIRDPFGKNVFYYRIDEVDEVGEHAQAGTSSGYIRLSYKITGSLHDVNNEVYRQVHEFLDLIATDVGMMLPYDKEEGTLSIAVSFPGTVGLYSLTDLHTEFNLAVNRIRSFNKYYYQRIQEYLKKKRCPLP